MFAKGTILNVSFKEKEEVKEKGARWDPSNKHWYVPSGVDLKPFDKWINNNNNSTTTVVTTYEEEEEEDDDDDDEKSFITLKLPLYLKPPKRTTELELIKRLGVIQKQEECYLPIGKTLIKIIEILKDQIEPIEVYELLLCKRINLRISYGYHERARDLGACYDSKLNLWYIDEGYRYKDLFLFKEWFSIEHSFALGYVLALVGKSSGLFCAVQEEEEEEEEELSSHINSSQKTTTTSSSTNSRSPLGVCFEFARTGKCKKDICTYRHDPTPLLQEGNNNNNKRRRRL